MGKYWILSVCRVSTWHLSTTHMMRRRSYRRNWVFRNTVISSQVCKKKNFHELKARSSRSQCLRQCLHSVKNGNLKIPTIGYNTDRGHPKNFIYIHFMRICLLPNKMSKHDIQPLRLEDDEGNFPNIRNPRWTDINNSLMKN